MTKPSKFDKVVKREVCQISSKGTRVYTPLDVEASTPNSNYLLSLVEKCPPGAKTSQYGVCFLDTTIGDFYLGQFEVDRCNSRILTLLAHYPPVHVSASRLIKGEHHCDGRKRKPFLRILFRTNLQFLWKNLITYL